ncbi:MAG: DUF4112 domain-containing protein [Deltaproteobacteria bacterium]|nr:DUF4112 domain-containing protein [Deltaproteobacteria bacterium]
MPQTKDHKAAPKGDIKQQTPDWAEGLVRFLDDGIRVPFTDFRFGFDALLGLLPVAGDAATGLTAAAILGLALKQGVPTIILLRMVGNIAVDTLLGMIPVVGDAFDLFYKSNRRNLDLIERFRDEDAEAGAADYAIVGVGFLLAVAMVALPFALFYVLGHAIVRAFGG